MPRPRAPELDLRSVDPALALSQRRFFDEQLPRGAKAADFSAFKPARYDAATIRWGLRAWQARTLDEYRSQVAFTELLLELSELGCSFDILTAGVRLVRDEARHVEVCRRLTLALGGDGIIPGRPSFVRSDPRRPHFERVMRSVMGSLCLGETLSAALLAATLKVTSDPLVRAVLTVLTSDESFHGQLGWKLLALLWPLATPPQRKRLERQLADDLAFVQQAAFANCEDDAGWKRNPLGDLKTAERRQVYDRALAKVRARFTAQGVTLPRPART